MRAAPPARQGGAPACSRGTGPSRKINLGSSGFAPFVIARGLSTLVCYCHTCAASTPRAVLPRLQSLLDQALSSEASEEEDFLVGVTFCEDSAEQDMICLNKSSVVFKWLFYAPSSGAGAKPLPEVRAKKREKGCMILEGIKEKMRTLPTDKSSTEVRQFCDMILVLHFFPR